MASPYIAESTDGDSIQRFPDWRELLVILMERAWIGITVALLVFAVVFVQLKRTVPQYRSSAVLMVQVQVPQILNYQDVVTANVRNLEYFNTVVKTLHSRTMIETAITEAGLAENKAFFPGVTSVVAKAAAAQSLIAIDPVERSRLINVSVVHPDPQVASDLANALARAYIQQDLDDRMSASVQAVEWLRIKSDEYRERVEEGRLRLQEYREKAESVSLEEDQNIVIAKLKSLNESLTAAQIERIDAETRWKSIQIQLDSEIPSEEIAAQLNDPGLSESLQAWLAAQRQLSELSQRYMSGHPKLQEALHASKILRERFVESCDLTVLGLRRRYETLQVKENALREALKKQEEEAFALARDLVRYNDLKQSVADDQELYQTMVSRMKEASVAESLPTDLIRLVEVARPAKAPFRPVPRRVLLRGGLLGVALGVGLIFLLYVTDHRLRRSEEVERALGIPVLSTLPLIGGRTIRDRGTSCHLNVMGEEAEAFRTFRTVIQVSPALQGMKTLLVTSTQPGEGKSLVSSNLAISFAQDGKRTLLLGVDLRRPAFKELFGMQKGDAGVREVLEGAVTWQKAVNSDLIAGVDVLSAGEVPVNPAELIGSPAMAELMEQVRDAYDRVIVDCSPVAGVSDALLMMRHVDCVLFVVRQGMTHSHGATHALRRLHDAGAPHVAAVMNGVNLNSLANYGYYRRYGAYAYRRQGDLS